MDGSASLRFANVTTCSSENGTGAVCGVSDAGALSCWMVNQTFDNAGVPINTTFVRLSLGPLEAQNFTEVSCSAPDVNASGRFHVCALAINGSIFCFEPGSAVEASPWHTAGPFGADVTTMCALVRVVCGIDAQGRLTCWGPDLANVTLRPFALDDYKFKEIGCAVRAQRCSSAAPSD